MFGNTNPDQDFSLFIMGVVEILGSTKVKTMVVVLSAINLLLLFTNEPASGFFFIFYVALWSGWIQKQPPWVSKFLAGLILGVVWRYYNVASEITISKANQILVANSSGRDRVATVLRCYRYLYILKYQSIAYVRWSKGYFLL